MKTQRLLLLSVSILILLIVLLMNSQSNDTQACVIEFADTGKAVPSEVVGSHGEGELQIEGLRSAFDSEMGTWFVSVNPETGVLPDLTFTGGYERAILSIDTADIKNVIENGTVCNLYLLKDGKWFEEYVVFSGLPIITIGAAMNEEAMLEGGEQLSECTVFDPADGGYQVSAFGAQFSYRGASSFYFEKHSFNMQIKRNNEKQAPYALLGLRASDKWILKSIFTDPDRMREKLAFELWNDLSDEEENTNIKTASMEYCEVFIGDEYYGLYYLMTKVEDDDIGFDSETDVLFRPKTFDLMRGELNEEQKLDIKGQGIRKPEVWNENIWEGPEWYAHRFYREDTREWPVDELTEHLDLPNFIDYALYYALVSAKDNNWTNTWYLFRSRGESFAMYKFPWDMDMSFGNTWTNGYPDMTDFDEGTVNSLGLPLDMRIVLRNDDGTIASMVRERYFDLRKDVFDTQNIIERIEQLSDALTETGAIAREKSRWNIMTIRGDGEQIADYITRHLAYMDAQMSDPTIQLW